MSGDKTPFNSQKKFSKYNKSTVEVLRTEIKNEFKQRIQSGRNKQVDSFRDLENDDEALEIIVKDSANDIRKLLLTGADDDPTDVLNLIAEVEQQVLLEEQQSQASAYEREREQEIQAMLPKCISCQKLFSDDDYNSILCDECSSAFNSQ